MNIIMLVILVLRKCLGGVDRMARKVKALAGTLEDLGLIPAQDPCDEVKELTPACTHAHHDTCVSLP